MENVPYEKVKSGVNKLNTLALCYRNTENYNYAIYYFNSALEHANKETESVDRYHQW